MALVCIMPSPLLLLAPESGLRKILHYGNAHLYYAGRIIMPDEYSDTIARYNAAESMVHQL